MIIFIILMLSMFCHIIQYFHGIFVFFQFCIDLVLVVAVAAVAAAAFSYSHVFLYSYEALLCQRKIKFIAIIFTTTK